MVERIPLNIHNETGRLRSVILGIADNRSADNHKNNPKYAEIVERGEDPADEALISEINNFGKLLECHGVTVFRPENIPNRTQIFARDIAFVIGDTLVRSNLRHENRRKETVAIDYLLKRIEKIITPPREALIEGGDVILWNNYVFVGQGDRTNNAGYEFLKSEFKDKQVIPIELNVTNDGKSSIVHLDYAFQPVGRDCAIIYEGAFPVKPQIIYDIFGEKNLIKVTQEEMYEMFPNVFSISSEIVVVESGFARLIIELEKRKIKVECIKYSNVSKLGGLLRCSTLPLNRE